MVIYEYKPQNLIFYPTKMDKTLFVLSVDGKITIEQNEYPNGNVVHLYEISAIESDIVYIYYKRKSIAHYNIKTKQVSINKWINDSSYNIIPIDNAKTSELFDELITNANFDADPDYLLYILNAINAYIINVINEYDLFIDTLNRNDEPFKFMPKRAGN